MTPTVKKAAALAAAFVVQAIAGSKLIADLGIDIDIEATVPVVADAIVFLLGMAAAVWSLWKMPPKDAGEPKAKQPPKIPPAALVALLALSVSGCGAGALEYHAKAAATSATALRATHAGIQVYCDSLEPAAVEIAKSAETAGDARAALLEHRKPCDTAIKYYDAARVSHATYLEGVGLAVEAEESSLKDAALARLPGLLRALLDQWAALQSLGLKLPDPPKMLTGLAGES
jgi:hypothetical protein